MVLIHGMLGFTKFRYIVNRTAVGKGAYFRYGDAVQVEVFAEDHFTAHQIKMFLRHRFNGEGVHKTEEVMVI